MSLYDIAMANGCSTTKGELATFLENRAWELGYMLSGPGNDAAKADIRTDLELVCAMHAWATASGTSATDPLYPADMQTGQSANGSGLDGR